MRGFPLTVLMGMHPHHRISSTAVLWTVVLSLQYASPQQAPESAISAVEPALAPTVGSNSNYSANSANSVIAVYSLGNPNFTQFGLPNKVLFANVTIR